MANIFVNGIAAKGGGGKSILNNYLSLLKENKNLHTYFVACPENMGYESYASECVVIITIPSKFNTPFVLPFTYFFYINKLIRDLKIDLVFNLADTPIRTNKKQFFLFDWSYAVYPESTVWDLMDFKNKLIRKSKLFFFRKNLKYISLLAAQNEAIRYRLKKYYGFKDIEIVPNAVSIDNLSGGEEKDFGLPRGKRLLYLTQYYEHKNLEVFIPLAKLIKERSLDYKLITTISNEQHHLADKFLNDIIVEGLDDIIINVGPIGMRHVPALYRQCNGLLMPTLLESFSGTYVEAMFHKLPIFTSDFDFARSVCRGGASYFSPFNAEDILEKLEHIFSSQELIEQQVEEAHEVLQSLPSWQEVFRIINSNIEELLIND